MEAVQVPQIKGAQGLESLDLLQSSTSIKATITVALVWLYLILLHSIQLYPTLQWLYYTLTRRYPTLQWLYLTKNKLCVMLTCEMDVGRKI